MAGIGFELRRLLYEDGGITARIQALLAATMITAGPWLLTMATLLLVSVFGTALEAEVQAAFRTLVTYAFAASMVTVGALQMPMTRHLADRLHDRAYDTVLPAFVVACAGVGALQCLTALALGGAIGLTGAALVAATALYVAVSLNWLAMAWLTVIREHGRILAAFAVGLVAAVGLATLLPASLGVAGPLAAYAAGQGLTFLLLAGLIGRGLEHGADRSPDVFRSVRRYPELFWIGLCYGAGIWIDKVVFWAGDGVSSAPFLVSHPLYDTSCFLAYLTIVPAMVLNLIVLETKFYERYRRYYAALVDGQPLSEVEWLRGEMIESLREGAVLMVRWQGLFTVLAIVCAPLLLGTLGLPEGMVRPFRLACVGAFFQVFLLIAVLVLLYFDLRREALRACAMFVALNGVFAVASLYAGYQVYGAGYAVAGLGALVAAWCSLQRSLPRLEYLALARAAGYGR